MRPINLIAVLWQLTALVAVAVFASAATAASAESKDFVMAAPQAAFQRVAIESLQTKGFFSSEPLMIVGYVLKAGKGRKTPAAVLAPACGGLMAPKGSFIRPWYRQMALRLKWMGITTVLVDGFTPRGRSEICSQDPRDRTIDIETRMKDLLAGLRYLRGRPDVDGDTIFLVTWGAAGGFRAMTRGIIESTKVHGAFKAAIMFYPRCAAQRDRLDAYAPIQVFVGERDDWNPAAQCLTLAKSTRAGSATIDVKVYPGAYHGFDHPEPPQKLDYVNHALSSVMVGGNPTAREDAYRRVARFLARFLPRGIAGTASAAVPGGGQGNAGFLSDDEIRKTIVGNTMHFTAPWNGRTLFLYYESDGRVLTKVASGDEVFAEKWVIGRNHMLCRTYGKANKWQCARVSRVAGTSKLRLVNPMTGLDIEASLLEGRQLQK